MTTHSYIVYFPSRLREWDAPLTDSDRAGLEDMLRYDAATVIKEISHRELLITGRNRPTVGRWSSFGIIVNPRPGVVGL